MTILFKVLDKKNKGRTPFTFARRVKKAQGSRGSGVPRLEQARVSQHHQLKKATI